MPNFDDIDLTDVIMDGDPYGNFEDSGGGDEGHVYDLEMSATNDEITLTEDGTDKTTLPLISTFVGTRAEWNALSVTEQAAYRILELKEEGTFERNPTTGNLTIVSSNNTNTEILNLVNPIGTIIHSTTCDTMAKVVAAYGGTTWIQHSGYILRGASSGVTDNNAVKDGGEDTHKLTAEESGLPAHGHGFTQPTVNGGGITNGISGGGHSHSLSNNTNVWRNDGGSANIASGSSTRRAQITISLSGDGSHTHTLPSHTHSVSGGAVQNHTGAAASSAHNIMQSYKDVYIWERIS